MARENLTTIRQKFNQRVLRVRRIVSGTAKRPRLAVYRSLKNITVQAIDDSAGKTIFSARSPKNFSGNKIQQAQAVGQIAAKLAVKNKIKNFVFDRRGYRYHGRVKALAEAIRAAGINI